MRVGLFVTCLVDLFRPNVGFATVRLLQHAGCRVEVPETQTCCGQPAYNNGDLAGARAIARQVIDSFDGYDHVVTPSASCAGMLVRHYPELFAGDPAWQRRARALAERSHELSRFLIDIAGRAPLPARYAGRVAYHDSCSALREMAVHDQPRQLLRAVDGLHLAELADSEVCCGFGGTFCVKYSAISERLAADKTRRVAASGADTLLAGDLGCLLHLCGHLKRHGSPIKVFHIAEVLAGMAGGPGLGEPDAGR